MGWMRARGRDARCVWYRLAPGQRAAIDSSRTGGIWMSGLLEGGMVVCMYFRGGWAAALQPA
jgi:hypothetical protein